MEAYKREIIFPEEQISIEPNIDQAPKPIRPTTTPTSTRQCSSPPPSKRHKISTPQRRANKKEHGIVKKERHLSVLNGKLTKMKDTLRKETQKMSTYSVKNTV